MQTKTSEEALSIKVQCKSCGHRQIYKGGVTCESCKTDSLQLQRTVGKEVKS